MNSRATRFRCFIVCLLLTAAAFAQQRLPTKQEKLGYPADARLLLIHADDLGMSHSENRATFEALEKGWVTSASIMVPCPWFPEVAAWARAHPHADLGVHLVLNSEWEGFRWGPVASHERVLSLLDKGGYFPNDPAMLTGARPPEVREELQAQVAKIRASGVHLTHLDSHMAALMSTPSLFAVYRELGKSERLPILYEPQGQFSAHAVPEALPDAPVDRVIALEAGVPLKDWAAWYKSQLAGLQPGVYEMIVHLAYDDDEMRGTINRGEDWGSAWRQSDLDMVRSPEFQQFLRDQKIVLIHWSDIAKIQ